MFLASMKNILLRRIFFAQDTQITILPHLPYISLKLYFPFKNETCMKNEEAYIDNTIISILFFILFYFIIYLLLFIYINRSL